MEFINRTIYGENRYQHELNDGKILYIKFQKNSEEAVATFVLGLPGGTEQMTKEESQQYRLGIEGKVTTYIGEHPDFVNVQFNDPKANFGDFYNKDGQLIKKLIIADDKYFKEDVDGNYYEAESNEKHPWTTSIETFVENYKEHQYELSAEIMEEKEKMANLFLELFKELLK